MGGGSPRRRASTRQQNSAVYGMVHTRRVANQREPIIPLLPLEGCKRAVVKRGENGYNRNAMCGVSRCVWRFGSVYRGWGVGAPHPCFALILCLIPTINDFSAGCKRFLANCGICGRISVLRRGNLPVGRNDGTGIPPFPHSRAAPGLFYLRAAPLPCPGKRATSCPGGPAPWRRRSAW